MSPTATGHGETAATATGQEELTATGQEELTATGQEEFKPSKTRTVEVHHRHLDWCVPQRFIDASVVFAPYAKHISRAQCGEALVAIVFLAKRFFLQ